VHAYIKKTRKLPTFEEAYDMAVWLVHQKTLHHKGLLSKVKYDLLASRGIVLTA
jgi:hypothetical protein